MSPLIIFWSISSAIVGAGFLVAAWNLRPPLKIPGGLIPFLFCLANGFYEIVFSVSLLIASSRMPGNNNTDVMVLWLVFYIPARFTSIVLALLLSGQITDGNLKDLIEAIERYFSFRPNR